MKSRGGTAQAERAKETSGGTQHRQSRVLNQKRPSQARSIADAVVIKDESLYFLCERDGQLPLRGRHGFGLYYHDCRYLGGYEIRLAGLQPSALVATSLRSRTAVLELTCPGFRAADGRRVEKEEIGVTWRRVLDARGLAMRERLHIRNYSLSQVEFLVTLAFRARFEPLFLVRGMSARGLGKARPPAWDGDRLVFDYEGSDGVNRGLQVHVDPTPERTDGGTAHVKVTLPPHGETELHVSLLLAESRDRSAAFRPMAEQRFDFGDDESAQDQSEGQWLESQTHVESSSRFLNAVLRRSLLDLHALRSSLHDEDYYAAGVPWFATLFGRDSLIAALQTLAFHPDVAAQTLRLLAGLQGTRVDDWRDEQPGKIPHEYRVGELANKGQVPYTPYYGSIDATPLFLIVLARHAAWTGELRLFQELKENVERALTWMADYGDRDGDGYLEYQSASNKGLSNQGWKDSGDSIVNADGSLAEPPIALAEVQGYVYMAKLGLVDLYRRAGDARTAERLRREADGLRDRFNRDYWLEDLQFYALALQKGHRPTSVIASNPGQALWTGIVDADKALKVVGRLLADDLFSGWGVRTLSARERRFNPIGYHLGTVWPHDNAMIAAGLRRYGALDAREKVFTGITDAAAHFHSFRLPEVFAGFRREDFGVPVRYPVACHPQAWAAGAVPFLLESMLGLEPDGFECRLRVVRPVLPRRVEWLELHRLRVGEAQADLRFQRTGADTVEVTLRRQSGPLEVAVER
jgi:glycogen debranching enzyme